MVSNNWFMHADSHWCSLLIIVVTTSMKLRKILNTATSWSVIGLCTPVFLLLMLETWWFSLLTFVEILHLFAKVRMRQHLRLDVHILAHPTDHLITVSSHLYFIMCFKLWMGNCCPSLSKSSSLLRHRSWGFRNMLALFLDWIELLSWIWQLPSFEDVLHLFELLLFDMLLIMRWHLLHLNTFPRTPNRNAWYYWCLLVFQAHLLFLLPRDTNLCWLDVIGVINDIKCDVYAHDFC